MTTARCIYREEREAAHVEIWDEGEHRSLWFDDVILQTEINLNDPAVLPNPVNRAMLAHLMFDRPLQRVLLAGCGGGAIARWFHARAPEVAGDAVELSPVVARLAREYFDFPRPDTHWRLLVGDVRDHLAQRPPHYDFILVDLEENQLTPDWVTDDRFLESCRSALTAHGVLTLNLLPRDQRAASEALLRIRRAFAGDTLLLNDPEHDNLLALAFGSSAPSVPDGDGLARLGRRWGIDFAGLAGRLTRVPPGHDDR